jgi:hypothetical protein
MKAVYVLQLLNFVQLLLSAGEGLSTLPAASNPALGSQQLQQQQQQQQQQHSPAGGLSAEAQQQTCPEVPADNDVWHEASEEWEEGDPAADAAAAAAAATAAAAAADEAFQRFQRELALLLEAGYTEAEIRHLYGVSVSHYGSAG